jgi:hypothetical protein
MGRHIDDTRKTWDDRQMKNVKKEWQIDETRKKGVADR